MGIFSIEIQPTISIDHILSNEATERQLEAKIAAAFQNGTARRLQTFAWEDITPANYPSGGTVTVTENEDGTGAVIFKDKQNLLDQATNFFLRRPREGVRVVSLPANGTTVRIGNTRSMPKAVFGLEGLILEQVQDVERVIVYKP